MTNKIFLVIAIIRVALIAFFATSSISHGFESVDYDLVRDSFQTLHDHTDLGEMIKECNTERAYRLWSDGLYVAIQQDCDKTIIVDVLTDMPSYERLWSKDVPFTNSMS